MLVKAYGDRRRLCSQGTCLIVGDQHSASSVQCFQFRIVSKAETMKLLPLNYATNNAVFSDLENGTKVADILPFPWDQQSPEQRTNKAPRKRLVIIARSVLRTISKLSQLQSIQCRPERWITLVPRECIYLSQQGCFFPRYDALWQITLPMGVDEQAPDGKFDTPKEILCSLWLAPTLLCIYISKLSFFGLLGHRYLSSTLKWYLQSLRG